MQILKMLSLLFVVFCVTGGDAEFIIGPDVILPPFGPKPDRPRPPTFPIQLPSSDEGINPLTPCVPGDFIPGPTCTSFYMCTGSLYKAKKVKFECAPGTVFDDELNVCVHGIGYKCFELAPGLPSVPSSVAPPGPLPPSPQVFPPAPSPGTVYPPIPVPNPSPPAPAPPPGPVFPPVPAPPPPSVWIPEPAPTPVPVPQPVPIGFPQPAPPPDPVPQPAPIGFPQPAPQPVPIGFPQPAPTPDPAPQPAPIGFPQPALTPDPAPQPSPQPAPQPPLTPDPAPQPAPIGFPQPALTPDPAPQPAPIGFPQPAPTPDPAPQPAPIGFPQPVPQPIPTPDPSPQPLPIGFPQPSPQPAPQPAITLVPISQPPPVGFSQTVPQSSPAPSLVPGPVPPAPSPPTAAVIPVQTTCPLYVLDAGSVFNCPQPGSYPDKTNCQKFFKCIVSKSCKIRGYSYRCPPGFLFDARSHKCEKQETAVCDRSADPANNIQDITSTVELTPEVLDIFFQSNYDWDLMAFLPKEIQRIVPVRPHSSSTRGTSGR